MKSPLIFNISKNSFHHYQNIIHERLLPWLTHSWYLHTFLGSLTWNCLCSSRKIRMSKRWRLPILRLVYQPTLRWFVRSQKSMCSKCRMPIYQPQSKLQMPARIEWWSVCQLLQRYFSSDFEDSIKRIRFY